MLVARGIDGRRPGVAVMWVSARKSVRILGPVVSGDAQAKAVLRLDVSRPWDHVAAQVASAMTGQRPLTPLSAALTSVRTRVAGGLPFVATYLGFVVLAADLARRVVEGHRLPTKRGGRPAYVWTPPPD